MRRRFHRPGSAARREFTLASDQDNALAYARPAPGTELTAEATDAYFERLGAGLGNAVELADATVNQDHDGCGDDC